MIMSSDELYDKFVNYDLEGPFILLEEAMDRLKYFNDTHPKFSLSTQDTKFVFFTQWDNDKLIGIAKLKLNGSFSSSHPDHKNWLSFLSVDKNYQNQGISKLLLLELFKYLSDNDIDQILISGYSHEGFKYLRKNIKKISNEFGIEIIDEDNIQFD